MLRTKLLLLAVSAIALAPVSASASSITFTDSNFNSADYTQSLVYTSNATLGYTFCSGCGQGGVPGLQVTLDSTGTVANPGVGSIGFINTTFSYDPAAGAVVSISASVDKILTDSIINPGAANTFRPTIEQNGNYYLAAIPGPSIPPGSDTTGWNTLSMSGLQASDFEEYDFTTGAFVDANPNFSGAPMLFGLSQTFTNPGEFNATAIYDPLQITLTIAGVPEPSTWAMLTIGFAGLGVFAQMAKKRREASAITA
jgi:hypothetical protein